MILEAVAVLEEEHPVLVDRGDLDTRTQRRFALWEGDEQPVIEDRRAFHVAARIRKCKKHAVELAAVQGIARSLARLLPQIKLELRPFVAKLGEHRRQKER